MLLGQPPNLPYQQTAHVCNFNVINKSIITKSPPKINSFKKRFSTKKYTVLFLERHTDSHNSCRLHSQLEKLSNQISKPHTDYDHLKLLAKNREFDEPMEELLQIIPKRFHRSKKINSYLIFKNAKIKSPIFQSVWKLCNKK